MINTRERIECRTYPVDNGCRYWQGAHSRGYPVVSFKGATYKVVRVLWYMEYGEWPNVCRHTCDDTRCVALEHIRDGSQGDNNRDTSQRGRHWQSFKTECPQGHPYTPENTLVYRNSRYCRQCDRDKKHRHRQANRAKRNKEQEPTA